VTVQKLIHGTLFAFEPRTPLAWKFTIGLTVGVIAVILMWFFVNEKGTPGAADNLISSVVGVILAKYSRPREKLKHTRLVFISYDAEAICLKCSRAFFKRHKKKYNDTKTWNFNVDCPYCLHDLKSLTHVVNGFVKLSLRFAEHLVRIAHELGYDSAKACSIYTFLQGQKPRIPPARGIVVGISGSR
jgi:hypothetical protein